MRCYICNYAPHVMNKDHEFIRGPEMYIDEKTGKDVCHKCHNTIKDTIIEDEINDLMTMEEAEEEVQYDMSQNMGACVQRIQDTKD